jgi:cytochrome P450
MDRDRTSTERQERRRGAPPSSPFKRWEARKRAAAEEAALHSGRGRLKEAPTRHHEADPSELILEGLDRDAEISVPPGPRRPAVAQTAQWVYRPIEFMERNRRRFGPCFRARLGPLRNVIFISDPALVKAVLTGDPDLLRTGDINGIFRPIIGEHSILVLDGPRHMEERRLLLPPFHGESLEGFHSVMTEVADREVRNWPHGKRFPVLPRMHAASTEIVLHAVLGVRNEGRLERLRDLLPRFLDLSQSPAVFMPFLRRPSGNRGSWGRLMHCIEELDEVLFEEIDQRRTEAVVEEEPRPDVLSMLVRARHEDGTAISNRELRDELVTLLVAGHETTSGALALAIEEIVRYPDVVEKLQRAASEDDDRYLEAVVREALRRKPVLPIVGRKLSRPARMGAYVLPKGAVLMPCAYLLHHEAAVYPDPHEFRPERFLEGPQGTYNWIPFGGGIRRCVGARFALMQMKVVLKAIFERLDVHPAGKPEPVRRRSVSVAPARGGQVIVEPRA